MNWESSTDIYILPYVKYRVGGKHRKLSSTLYDDPEQEDGEAPRGRGDVYTSGSFMLLCNRNLHNTVKQLSSN